MTKREPLLSAYGKSEDDLSAEVLYEMIKGSNKKQAIQIIKLNMPSPSKWMGEGGVLIGQDGNRKMKEVKFDTSTIDKESVNLRKDTPSVDKQECDYHCHFDYPEACTGLHPMECKHCKQLENSKCDCDVHTNCLHLSPHCKPKQSWEEEFDKKFKFYVAPEKYGDLDNFIKQELAKKDLDIFKLYGNLLEKPKLPVIKFEKVGEIYGVKLGYFKVELANIEGDK